MVTYLLVAIDGTNSNGFGYSGGSDDSLRICAQNESYVQAFHRLVKIPANRKYYAAGPGIRTYQGAGGLGETADAATGAGCDEIEANAWRWLTAQLREDPTARVILVGHSRGGHIVTDIAIRLASLVEGHFVPRSPSAHFAPHSPSTHLVPPLPSTDGCFNYEHQAVHFELPQHLRAFQGVYFLGLYDAVDMTYQLGDTAVVPANVVWCFHALRSRRVGSRESWGNTATRTARADRQHYFQREFDASHGSIGGAMPEACDGSLGRDRNLAFVAGSVLAAGNPLGGLLVENVAGNVVASCRVSLTAAQNLAGGRRANLFILGGARQAGIPMD